MSSISRRGFFGASAAGVASTVLLNGRVAKAAPNERIRIGGEALDDDRVAGCGRYALVYWDGVHLDWHGDD